MDLQILSLSQAVAHLPDKPTYAIRIFNSQEQSAHLFNLQSSENYIGIDSYRFDDNEEYGRPSGPVSITEDMAKRIIENFIKYKDRINSLLVHCSKGQNRSPSVAMALNNIFGLGYDTQELLKKFPDCNRLVYNTLWKIGNSLGTKDYHNK